MKRAGSIWAAFCAGIVFSALAFFLLPSIQLSRVPVPIPASKSSSFHAPKRNVFAELTSHERAEVSTCFRENAGTFGLRHSTNKLDELNWISQIEVLRPNKSDVVAYFNNKFLEPDRYARVSVVQNDGNKAFLSDFMVGPLPPSNNTRIEPLVYNSGRNYIQSSLPDITLLYMVALGIGNDVADITDDLFGARVDMLDPLGPNSLGLGARPVSIDGDNINLWLEFFRAGAGSNAASLLPQGLYVRLDIASPNPDNWTTSEWFYDGILYDDIKAFRTAWSSPNFTKVSANLDGSWTDTEDFHAQPRGRRLRPPLSIQPHGPRYQLDREQQYISWMGFTFYLATSPSTAVSLFDIRFNNDRIIYHLGLQEALAHYAGSEPIQSGLEFLDTLFGMGNRMFTLVPGYDCPAYADYLDMTYHTGEKTYTNKNAICIFEYTSDAPLQRHTSEWSVTVSRNTYLVVRSVSTVGNYDYTIDFLFYLDGSMEVKVRASGFIFAGFAGHPEPKSDNMSSNADTAGNEAPTEEIRSRDDSTRPIPHPNARYGYQIRPSASTSMHDHVLLFRCDFDISPHSGQNDTFKRVSIDPYTHLYPWDAPSLPTARNTMRLTHHPALPRESALNWPSNSASLYLIESPILNAWGEHKAYRIQPGTGVGTPSHLTILNSSSLQNSALWSSADLWILKNHPSTEPAAAHPLNYLSPADPLIDFAKIANDEALNDEHAGGDDLVVYFNLGGHHVPQSGDIPNTLMHTSASSVLLSPFNYFDEDVSKYSRQGVRVDANTREDVGWVEGMRVVGGGRYDEMGEEVVLSVKDDLEPKVDGYFKGEERGENVGKRVGGGLWGLWGGR